MLIIAIEIFFVLVTAEVLPLGKFHVLPMAEGKTLRHIKKPIFHKRSLFHFHVAITFQFECESKFHLGYSSCTTLDDEHYILLPNRRRGQSESRNFVRHKCTYSSKKGSISAHSNETTSV